MRKGSHAFWQMHFYDLSLTFQVVCYINSLIYRDWTYKSNFQPKIYFKSKHLIFFIYLKIDYKFTPLSAWLISKD